MSCLTFEAEAAAAAPLAATVAGTGCVLLPPLFPTPVPVPAPVAVGAAVSTGRARLGGAAWLDGLA